MVAVITVIIRFIVSLLRIAAMGIFLLLGQITRIGVLDILS